MGEAYNPSYCSSFAALFRSTLLKRILEDEHRKWLDPLLRDASFAHMNELPSWKLGDLLDLVYLVIRKEYKCEYVYKNALADLIISDSHPASSFTEFWANNSK